ncbi:MAG: CoA-binding protein [Pseudobdellovibrionaceae bacterium]
MGYNVAILGASDDKSRYSNQALHLLAQYKHKVFPVHPTLKEISGHPVFSDLASIPEKIDTLTIYVRPEISTPLKDVILRLNPKRVIFNPGAENSKLASELENHGIYVENACTLVLLRTGQFAVPDRQA